MKAWLAKLCFALIFSFVLQPSTFNLQLSSIRPALPRLSLSSENFRVSYPSRVERRDVEAALRALEAARGDVMRRLSSASVSAGGLGSTELYVHDTAGDFAGATGQPAWVGAVARGRRIESQPLDALRRRGVLAGTLRHEYVHVAVEALGHGRAPRWLAEGVAVYVSGEGAALARRARKTRMSLDELEQRLSRPNSPEEMRLLYAAAYREVSALASREGEAGVWRLVARQ
ncbi:MAG: hypothetical protein LC754_09565 [Acidobacteria bacterium]|nr:hypothetical protein [Acidobacteriota bacterium]